MLVHNLKLASASTHKCTVVVQSSYYERDKHIADLVKMIRVHIKDQTTIRTSQRSTLRRKSNGITDMNLKSPARLPKHQGYRSVRVGIRKQWRIYAGPTQPIPETLIVTYFRISLSL